MSESGNRIGFHFPIYFMDTYAKKICRGFFRPGRERFKNGRPFKHGFGKKPAGKARSLPESLFLFISL